MEANLFSLFFRPIFRAIVATWLVLAPIEPVAAGHAAGGACKSQSRLTIAAVGDLLFQPQLQQQARRQGRTFRKFWTDLEPLLRGAGITYGNIEGPVARRPQDGFASWHGRQRDGSWNNDLVPLLGFSYPASLIDDLLTSGFDVVSTANNHALDRGGQGVDLTIENLRARSLAFTGTRHSQEPTASWSTVIVSGPFRIAWLACTYGYNGNVDRHHQVLHCFRDRDELLAEVRRLAEDATIDAVVLTPHWGLEGVVRTQPEEEALAHDAVGAGALLVIGTHPHVVQRWEHVRRTDGREALVIYSTGNFISNQAKPAARTGIVALVDLVKARDGGAEIASAQFVLTRIEEEPSFRVVEDVTTILPAVLPGHLRMAADYHVKKQSCVDD